MDLLVGKRLGQYEILDKLGSGGMATVYRAKQISVNRDVAVKVIRPDLASTEGFLERFEREAKVIAALSHPYILKVFDYGQDSGYTYIVIELQSGGSLAGLIREYGSLPLDRTLRFASQISQALDYAHGQGVIHRDLKPENVLLDKSQNAFLTDFGIAKLVNSSSTALTQTGMVMGTPSYMAPELWQGLAADARTDVYAFGIMLFNMLTGKMPFRADTPFHLMHLHVSELPPAVSGEIGGIPTAVDGVIGRALAKVREDRYNSAGEMMSALELAARGGVTSVPAAKPAAGVPDTVRLDSKTPAAATVGGAKPAPADIAASAPTPGTGSNRAETRVAPKRRTGWLSIGIVVALLALGAVGALLLGNRPPEPTPTTQPTNTVQSVAQNPTATNTVAIDTAVPTTPVLPTTAPTVVPTTAASAAAVLPTDTARPSDTAVPTTTVIPSSSTPLPTDTSAPSSTPAPTDTAAPTNTPLPTTTPLPTSTPLPTNTPLPTIDITAIIAATLSPLQTATANAQILEATLNAALTQIAINAASTQQAAQTAVAIQQAAVQGTLTQVAFAVQATLAARSTATPTRIVMISSPSPTVVTVVNCPGFLPSRLVVGQKGRVTPGDPNRLRETPAGTKIVGQIPGGEIFDVLEGPVCASGKAWWRVRWSGIVGWTAEGENNVYWLEPYLVCPGFLPSRLQAGSLGRVLPGPNNALNSQPARPSVNPNSKRIGSIPAGAVFTVIEGPICDPEGIAWWRVNYNGQIGYTGEGQGNAYWVEPVS